MFERNGFEGVIGIMEYPTLRKRDTIILTEADRELLVQMEIEILNIIECEQCPPLEKRNICKRCSYYEFCFTNEIET